MVSPGRSSATLIPLVPDADGSGSV